MEQIFSRSIAKVALRSQHTLVSKGALLLVLSCLILIGCKKSIDRTPEKSDAIYNDLISEHARYEKEVVDTAKQIEEVEKKLDKLPPRDPQGWMMRKELRIYKKKVSTAEQMSRYYRLRAEKRLHYVRKFYLKAYYEDLPWPDPGEYPKYLAQKRLKNASRNWNDRVPKPQFVLPKEREPSSDKKEDGGGGH